MTLTLADRLTLVRLLLAPLIIAAYLLLPVQWSWCFWITGLLCAIAEWTDLLDGQVARRRNEVSDFGKLADPFCDVFYRQAVFLVFLLPAGGVGWPVHTAGDPVLINDPGSLATSVPLSGVWQSVFAVGVDAKGHAVLGAGLVPWLPVLLMVLREIVAGALRAMTATKGLVLAARTSGKIKAWVQGFAIITLMAFPCCWFQRFPWHLTYAAIVTWLCAALSVVSILEYIWVNRGVLAQLVQRRKA